VGHGCGTVVATAMKVGDLERWCWLRIPLHESMVAPLGPRPPRINGGSMGISGCV
jgi:hypothetical protein